MSSSLKPLEQFSHGAFCQKGIANLFKWFCAIELKMAAMPIYGRKKSSFPEPRKLWGWILVYSIEDSKSTKFVQMMT